LLLITALWILLFVDGIAQKFDGGQWTTMIMMTVMALSGFALLHWNTSISNTYRLKVLFPLNGYITQEIIDKANVNDPKRCIGALTLKEALNNNNKLLSHCIYWADTDGNVKVDKKWLSITTIENIDFMKVIEPQSVTFIIK